MINDTTSYSQYINCPEKFVKRSFQKAVDIIDDEFGDGYARKNPVLLSHLVTTQARVYCFLLGYDDDQSPQLNDIEYKAITTMREW